MPFSFLNGLAIVPYYVGATGGPGRLGRMLREAGFEVVECGALMHIPRVVAVAVSSWIPNRGGAKLQTAFLNALDFFERLEAFPTRFFTGNFVAVRALQEWARSNFRRLPPKGAHVPPQTRKLIKALDFSLAFMGKLYARQPYRNVSSMAVRLGRSKSVKALGLFGREL